MGSNLTGWHGLILLLVVLLLFAAPKLPGLARSLGQSITIFRGEVKKPVADDDSAPETDSAAKDDATKPSA
jgi:sec-independent protein translocase protein TatA